MTAPGVERELAGPREVWRAVDALLNPTSVRLVRDDKTSERVALPSLFNQLVEAIESGAGSSAHGVQESKPPLDLAAMTLLLEIAGTVRSGCWNWHLKRTFDTPKDLRKVVSAVMTHGDPRLIDMTCRKIQRWVMRVKATISSGPDRTWRMHGGACRVCASVTVPCFDEDGNMTRVPALIVHSEDGVIDHVVCDFCGSTLTGDDLTGIVLDTLNSRQGRLSA